MRRILVEWRAAERARRAGAPSVEVLIDIGDPALTIVRVSEDLEADLIVMGRRGRGRPRCVRGDDRLLAEPPRQSIPTGFPIGE